MKSVRICTYLSTKSPRIWCAPTRRKRTPARWGVSYNAPQWYTKSYSLSHSLSFSLAKVNGSLFSHILCHFSFQRYMNGYLPSYSLPFILSMVCEDLLLTNIFQTLLWSKEQSFMIIIILVLWGFSLCSAVQAFVITIIILKFRPCYMITVMSVLKQVKMQVEL